MKRIIFTIKRSDGFYDFIFQPDSVYNVYCVRDVFQKMREITDSFIAFDVSVLFRLSWGD